MSVGVRTKKKYISTVAYDGTHYAGFQVQPNAPTIQQSIEKALERIHKKPIKIFGSGRTDAGVHAKGQVFHFETELEIAESNWTRAINANLGRDIRILETVEAPLDFHARYSVKKKEYRYFLHRGAVENPFRRLYTYHIPRTLDMELIQQATQLFIGEHDFTAFSSAKSNVQNKVRTIYRLEVVPMGDELIVICEGNGFLYNMVRIIVGTLIEVGLGNISLEHIQEAFITKNRKLVGVSAPPQGLFLWKVTY